MRGRLEVVASLAGGEAVPPPDAAGERLPTSPSKMFEGMVVSHPSLKVSIKANSSELVRQVQAIFSAALPQTDFDGIGRQPTKTPTYEYEVLDDGQVSFPAYQVVLNGRHEFQVPIPDELLYRLEGSITDRLTRSLTQYHLFHGGAVARNGRGILLPGPSRAGKSTIVAALALSGFDYCSDEVGVLGCEARLRPFPKVISLKNGGWQRIAIDFPVASQRHLVWGLAEADIWYLQAPQLPDEDRAASGYPMDFIVLPGYSAREETRLERVPKSTALTWLVEQSLDLPVWGAPGFDLIVGMVRRAECYALSIGSLPRAVELVEDLTR